MRKEFEMEGSPILLTSNMETLVVWVLKGVLTTWGGPVRDVKTEWVSGAGDDRYDLR